MKNISSFYGGAISTNNREFKNFYEKYDKLKNFQSTSDQSNIYFYNFKNNVYYYFIQNIFYTYH